MIGKYGIPADERYLYFWMLCRVYRIGREDGFVEVWTEPVAVETWKRMRESGGTPALPAGGALPADAVWERTQNGVAMTLYDVLCYGKDDAAATGDFINLDSLVTLISATGNPGGNLLARYVKQLDPHPAELERALAGLGGFPEGKADISYEMPLFEFMNIRFQLWHADDEFPAMTQIYVDKGILTYMHFETVWYLMHHYMDLLTEETKKQISGYNHEKTASDLLY